MRQRIGVLALQGAVAEHTRILDRLGAQTVEVRRADQLEDLDGLVVPGGESTAIARIARASGLLSEVRVRIDAGLPVLGTCAGLILLADRIEDPGVLAELPVIGGLDIAAQRNGYGRQRESFVTELELDGARMRAAFIRAPRILRVGAGVEVLARHAGEPVAVRQKTIIAASFHPELTDYPELHRLLLVAAAEARGSGHAAWA